MSWGPPLFGRSLRDPAAQDNARKVKRSPAGVAGVAGALGRAAGARGIDFDRCAQQAGPRRPRDWPALGGPLSLVARVVMWVILLAGLLAGLSALDAALPERFARTIFAYLPDVLAALPILAVGVLMARFLARAVLIGSTHG